MRNFLCFCLITLAHFAYGQGEPVVKKVNYPSGYIAKIDAVYTNVNNWEGKMDLYLVSKTKEPSPIIINIHGGGWARGNKEAQTGFGSFFKQGYAVANIAYRLAPTAKAPAAIEDTRCALIYLIKNAKELNIDINKIVIMGSSAGGHLALMAGLLANNNVFDGNCLGVAHVKVAAIINKFGVADLSSTGFGDQTSKTVKYWLGDKFGDNNFKKSISPIYQITKDSPPVFTVHGDADPTVPYQQSIDLTKKLNELGVKNEFMTIKGGGHGGFTAENNSELSQRIINFLKQNGL